MGYSETLGFQRQCESMQFLMETAAGPGKILVLPWNVEAKASHGKGVF
jgi:hypothetical protein